MALIEFKNKGEVGYEDYPASAGNLNYNFREVINLVYPIGSIFISVNNTNPSTLLGGTWEAWGNGRVPVGVDPNQTEFNSVEKLGGEATHTLTINEMASHGHAGYYRYHIVQNASGGVYVAGLSDAKDGDAGAGVARATGGDQPHNNLQPYITCYMWKRTA